MEEQYTVIVAYEKKEYDYDYVKDNIEYISADLYSLWPYFRMDYSFVFQHKDDFEKIYKKLEDEKSKRTMEAFLNQRISGKFEYLEELWEGNQYYDKELVNLKNMSCIVDCGAYDGDSFILFCKNFEQDAGVPYDGKAFLLEPDENNYQKLSDRYYRNEKIITKKLGAWNKKAVLHFDTNERNSEGSRISQEGTTTIAVDEIDNIVFEQDKVDFIKMDIEGSELNALKGAQKTIQKYHPVLTICVYHKKDDLLLIPTYIKSLYAGYKLYLRAHKKYCTDVVLYALPD